MFEYPTLLNRNEDIDKSLLPKKLHELSDQLEKFDEMGDWAHYAMLCEEFELDVKYAYMNGKISAKQFHKLNRKYCGYED